MKQYAALDDSVYFWFAANDTSGSGGDGASPAADVRLAGAAADAAPVYSPTPILLSHANYPAGAYEIAIAATAGNGFASNNTYAIFCTLAIDAQNPTGFVGSFDLKPVEANVTQLLDTAWLTPSVPGTPDVNTKLLGGTAQTGNDVGADVNSILEDTGTTLDTLIKDIPTVSEFEARSILAADYVVVGDTIAGVTAVTNDVGITQAGADKVWGTAARALTDKTGFGLSTAGILAIWHQLTANIVTANTIGKLLKDDINATISSRSSHAAADIWSAGTRALTDKAGFALSAAGITAIWEKNISAFSGAGYAGTYVKTLYDDWINAGRLDAILDIIAADVVNIDGDAMRGTDGANTTTPPTVNAIADQVWDELLTGASHNIATSAGRRLRDLSALSIHSGTAQAGTATTITLVADADGGNGVFNRNLIVIISGTGAGQTRTIVDYNDTTKVCIIDRDWRITPDATSEYQILADDTPLVVDHGVAQAGTATTITLRDYASAIDNTYLCNIITIIAGTGCGQARLVGSYNGSTKVVTICGDNWVTNPDNTSVYVMIPYGTTCTSCIGTYALSQINAECDTALNTAIPGSPVADSINERVKAIDILSEASGDGDLAGILADTNELQTDWVNGGRLDLIIDSLALEATLTAMKGSGFLTGTDSLEAIRNRGDAAWAGGGSATDIADAVWDELQSGHTDAGSFGKYLDAAISGVGGAIGSGALSCTWTQKDDEENPMDNVQVWITTDVAGTNVVAGTLITDANGEVTFMLDEGTYYVWRERAGYNFTNPQTWAVS